MKTRNPMIVLIVIAFVVGVALMALPSLYTPHGEVHLVGDVVQAGDVSVQVVQFTYHTDLAPFPVKDGYKWLSVDLDVSDPSGFRYRTYTLHDKYENKYRVERSEQITVHEGRYQARVWFQVPEDTKDLGLVLGFYNWFDFALIAIP